MRTITTVCFALGVAAGAAAPARAQQNGADRGRTIAIGGGIELYTETHGSGSPLVLLHNFGTSTKFWEPFLPDLTRDYQVILVDQRGHGRSSLNPKPEFRHRESAADVLAALDGLGVDRFRIIGMSSGGMTALHMALGQPERVEAMVLVSGTHVYTEELRRYTRNPRCHELSPDRRLFYLQHHSRGDVQVRQMVEQWCRFADIHDDMNLGPDELARVRARTLIVHGDRDKLFPARIAEEMHRWIPTSYLWVIPNGEHLPVFQAEQRAAFTRTALEFLSGAWEGDAAQR